jgi:hypothetical protein
MTTSGTEREPTVRSSPVRAWAVLVPAAAVVVAARVVGTWDGVGRLSLGAAPLIGRWDLDVVPRALVPAVIGAGLVAALPSAAARLRWAQLLVLGWASSAAYALSLAWVDGAGAIAEPLTTGYEYRAVIGDVDRSGVGRFVGDFVDQLPTYPTHVRGHPVGAPLVFWAQEQVGLTGAGWSAALVILAGTSVVVSVAVAVRAVAGEAVARRVIPFVVVPPALVWVATSFDALVAGVVAASIALAVVGASRGGPAGDLAALGGGVGGALALHLTYGAPLLLLPAVAVVAVRLRLRPVVMAVVGAGAVTAVFVAAGFWWFDGLAATRAEYAAGAGGHRPYWYFAALANPAALLLAAGPAVPVALARLRDRRVWTVVAGALAGVVIADLSGLSKGEVERIWLPFVPWLTVATAVLADRPRRWLALQAGVALFLQLALDSPW